MMRTYRPHQHSLSDCVAWRGRGYVNRAERDRRRMPMAHACHVQL
jgi:hypothetical protein